MQSISSREGAQQRASQTAYECAAVRAAVYAWTGCDAFDYLAAQFVAGPSASLRARLGVAIAGLRVPALSKLLISSVAPGADVLLFARQAVPDEMVRTALRENPHTQIVILGAGLDTSALRIGAERRRAGAAPGNFYEVDSPATLAEKRRLVDRVAGSLGESFGEHIRYVPCRFGEDDLRIALLGAGFDVSIPCIWIWSGVIHYLGDATVRAMIAGLQPLSHPGSQLFFDYIALEAYQDPAKYEFSRIKARFDAFGEVMSFGFRQGGDHVRQWLASQGLQLLQHYTALDMVAVYERMVGAPAPSKGAPWANLCVARF